MQASDEAIEAIKKAYVDIKGKSTATEPKVKPSEEEDSEPPSSVLAKRQPSETPLHHQRHEMNQRRSKLIHLLMPSLQSIHPLLTLL
ncbi:hypothetical protein L6452_30839 [Arctium lappa]|uniref:Uncharacterized protein n=1 Tax=Arctium lappa TaxID=4217 RepID=A0ACB8ZIU7_ARCLA|nr:hypothetical protein L6452_30839 [Arctium lappa]